MDGWCTMESRGPSSNNWQVAIHYVQLLIRLYFLVFLALTVALPFTFILSAGRWDQDGIVLTSLQIYSYAAGSAFLLYLSVYGKYIQTHSIASVKGESEQNNGPGVAPPFYDCEEGVNLFLRFGLVAFAVMSMLVEGLWLVAMLDRPELISECYGTAKPIALILSIFFISLQTYVLFKYHKACFNFHLPLVSWGFCHMIATNLLGWATTTSIEAYENFMEYREYKERMKEHDHTDAHANNDEHHNWYHNSSDRHSHEIRNESSGYEAVENCIMPNTVITILGPYLFPFYIEYVLLAAAISYKLLITSGPASYNSDNHEEEEDSDVLSRNTCHKANVGIFIGLLPFTAVILGAVSFVYYSALGRQSIFTLIHVISDLSVNSLSLIVLFPTVQLLRKLTFLSRLKFNLDQAVLLITLAGSYILMFSLIVSSFTIHVYESGDGLPLGIMSLVNLVQSTLQTGFILHAIHRYPSNREHVQMKPGRSLLTLLIIFNFAMWVINTFELKEVLFDRSSVRFYGLVAWIVLVDATLPLAIFFRFHSAVCLTEIWIHAYRSRAPDKIEPAVDNNDTNVRNVESPKDVRSTRI